MSATLPPLTDFNNGLKIAAKELRQLWVAAKVMSNVFGYTKSDGTTLLSGFAATTNTLFGTSVPFTKLRNSSQSKLVAIVNVDFFWAAGTPNTAHFGIGTGDGQGFNIDTDVCQFGGNVNGHHDVAMGVNEIIGLDAGQYNACLYARVTGGSITSNNSDTVSMWLNEIPL